MNDTYDFYQDTISEFLTRKAAFGERASVSLDALHAAYQGWCTSHKVTSANRIWFGRLALKHARLNGLTVTSRQHTGRVFYLGLALKE